MENLKIKLQEIKAQKEQELASMKDDTHIDYAILEQEIYDAEYGIESCQVKDADYALGGLFSLLKTTTSNSVYEAVKEYLKSIKDVVFLDLQTREYHTYESVESLAEILIKDWLTNEFNELPAFKDEADKLEFYKYIIDLYEYEKAEVA